MEHPLRVDEFSPAETAPSAPVGMTPEAAPMIAAPATPLPPLPGLSAADALLLKPSDAHYADYLAAANIRTQAAPSPELPPRHRLMRRRPGQAIRSAIR